MLDFNGKDYPRWNYPVWSHFRTDQMGYLKTVKMQQKFGWWQNSVCSEQHFTPNQNYFTRTMSMSPGQIPCLVLEKLALNFIVNCLSHPDRFALTGTLVLGLWLTGQIWNFHILAGCKICYDICLMQISCYFGCFLLIDPWAWGLKFFTLCFIWSTEGLFLQVLVPPFFKQYFKFVVSLPG